jgi:hypothetical protein
MPEFYIEKRWHNSKGGNNDITIIGSNTYRSYDEAKEILLMEILEAGHIRLLSDSCKVTDNDIEPGAYAVWDCDTLLEYKKDITVRDLGWFWSNKREYQSVNHISSYYIIERVSREEKNEENEEDDEEEEEEDEDEEEEDEKGEKDEGKEEDKSIRVMNFMGTILSDGKPMQINQFKVYKRTISKFKKTEILI